MLAVKASARRSVPGIVHDSSGSGQTLFVEPFAVVELSNRQSEVAGAEREEATRILRELSDAVGTRAEALAALVEAAAEIDLALACGTLSRGWRGAAVEVSDEVRLLAARHPLLDPAAAVPIDLDLGGLRALVVSGPNTGGKTVALKTLGLAALLHQAGLRPPAEVAALPVFDRVLADIGDPQSIEMSLSTFSGHLRNLIAILDDASPRSLVLVDELASGTDPVEGSALAQALLERLATQARLTVVTTHYPELKEWASATEGAANAATAPRPEPRTSRCTGSRSAGRASRTRSRRPTGSGSTRASSRRPGHGSRPSGCGSRSSSPSRRRPSARRRRRARRPRRSGGRPRRSRPGPPRARRSSAPRWRRSAPRRSGSESGRSPRPSATSAPRGPSSRRSARRSASPAAATGRRAGTRPRPSASATGGSARPRSAPRGRSRSSAPSPSRSRRSRRSRSGDPVEAPELGIRGTIVAIDGDEAEVAGTSGQRVRIAVARLRPDAGAAPAAEEPPAVRVLAAARGDVSDELDVRGRSSQEAREAVRSFVDDAALAGLGSVRVVHGRGTGALRTAVRNELDRHPLVEGRESDSADGATVVTLGR